LSNIKNNYFESIQRKVDQEHIEKPATIIVQLNKNHRMSILSSELNSTTLLIFVYYVTEVYIVHKIFSTLHVKMAVERNG